MMKQRDFFSTSLFAVLFTAMFACSALADSATEQIRDNFNNMNNQQGYAFNWQPGTDYSGYFGLRTGEIRLVNNGDQTPDLSAYQNGVTANAGTGTDFYFQTFCVAPELDSTLSRFSQGRLNYDNDTTVTYNGNPLTLGVAYLYKEFAAGVLPDYDFTYGSGRADSSEMLQDAIWYLMSMGMSEQDRNLYEYHRHMVNRDTDWGNNDFLSGLLAIKNDTSFWIAAYNPALDYDGLMGYTKVFVVNVLVLDDDSLPKQGGPISQDVLYAATVCEPASLLLWTLGSLGAAGIAQRKRRKTL